MASKSKPIKKPDTTNESHGYWEKVLKSRNLSMDRGLPDRRLVSYVGDAQNLNGIVEERIRTGSGKVFPPGHKPD